LLFAEQSTKLLSKTERDKVMEITTSWEEKGIEKGRQQGEFQLILRQLNGALDR
jgi:hypothetical protein